MAVIVDRRGSEWWVWDVATLDWVKGQQPILEGGTIVISGTVAVTGPLTNTQLRAAGVPVLQNLSIAPHDYISLAYTGTNLTTVTFKTGGSGGTTVQTLTLAYSGSTLTSVTKT